MKLKIVAALLIAGGVVAPAAYATDGYLPIGYGIKNEAMGGASIALPLDSIAAANNPAGMVLVGDRTDFGLTLFKPNRSSTLAGTCMVNANPCPGPASLDGTYDGNGRSNFFVPQFGYNRMMDANTSLGVSVYGNGGMNTQYNTSPISNFNAALGGIPGAKVGGNYGINLAQLFISPTWSMKVNDKNAVGVSLNIAYQMFSATGLGAFNYFFSQQFPLDQTKWSASSNPAALTDNGTDASTGYGVRLGWIGEVSPAVTLGVTYQSKTKMGQLTKYAGLFQNQGNFDIPANYGVGVAVKANPATTVAFDVEHVDYGGVPTIANLASITAPGVLGTSGGPGFGWQSINTYKLGMSYAYDPGMTLRAGLNHCDQPVTNNAAFLNMLAPGIVQDHLTLGATWKLANKSELSVNYIHAFKKSISGPTPMGGTATLSMYEDSIGVAYGW